MKIYLAGPLFSTAEREFNVRLARLLRDAGHEVWLPQEQQGRTAAETFRTDVGGIDRADALVANMDGPDPDSGTCWECGYAYGRKPVIVFRTDFRAGEEPGKAPYNLMLTESATRQLLLPFADADTVARRITRSLASLRIREGGDAPLRAFTARSRRRRGDRRVTSDDSPPPRRAGGRGRATRS